MAGPVGKSLHVAWLSATLTLFSCCSGVEDFRPPGARYLVANRDDLQKFVRSVEARRGNSFQFFEVATPEDDEALIAEVIEEARAAGFDHVGSQPCVMTEASDWMARLFLARPVELGVLASDLRDMLPWLWVEGIPHGVWPGNVCPLYVPREWADRVRERIRSGAAPTER